ncbi:MAG: zinc metallopeptidase [Kofleriaceae bacterium]
MISGRRSRWTCGDIAAWGILAVTLAWFVGPAIAGLVLLAPWLVELWPVVVIAFVPALGSVVLHVVVGYKRRALAQPLAVPAAAWLRERVAGLGLVGIKVTRYNRRGADTSFYTPDEQTIALGLGVYDSHAPEARAVAAHELGHALFHLDQPRLSSLLLAARRWAHPAYAAALGALIGAALVGAGAMVWLGLALAVVTVVLRALVLVDEILASDLAFRHLLDDDATAEARRCFEDELRFARATYLAAAALAVVPLASSPWLVGAIGGGVVPPTPGLAGAPAWLASFACACLVVVACHGLVTLIDRFVVRLGRLVVVTSIGAIGVGPWTPLVPVLLMAQPGVPRWAAALAMVEAWPRLAAIVETGVVAVTAWCIPAAGAGYGPRSPGPTDFKRATPTVGRPRVAYASVLRLLAAPLAAWWLWWA